MEEFDAKFEPVAARPPDTLQQASAAKQSKPNPLEGGQLGRPLSEQLERCRFAVEWQKKNELAKAEPFAYCTRDGKMLALAEFIKPERRIDMIPLYLAAPSYANPYTGLFNGDPASTEIVSKQFLNHKGNEMENQHRKITGYRELSQGEIDLMNEIKQKGEDLGSLIKRLQVAQKTEVEALQFKQDGDANEWAEKVEANLNARHWTQIGKDQLQLGIMALTRAVARPTSF